MKYCWLILLLVSSCKKVEEIKQVLDYKSFEFSGGTLFSVPALVTTKEIHFDIGKLLGREVILEGKVESLGKYDTHIVISDESGKMLVVLTHIENVSHFLEDGVQKPIRVLGTVERGKKGLPYVLAKSINVYEIENQP